MLTAITNQHTWVYGCYAYYLENQIEPGNPEDGVWEAAHWPVPKHKGGTKTILLLKEHHAVHGVLQSEEWQCPCIWGWEKDYIPEAYVPLYTKWKSKLGHLAGGANKKAWEKLPFEEREARKEAAKQCASGYINSLTPEQRKERNRQATAKPIKVTSLETGEVQVFYSLGEARRFTGCSSSTLQRRIKLTYAQQEQAYEASRKKEQPYVYEVAPG